jgi:hypothetical protein
LPDADKDRIALGPGDNTFVDHRIEQARAFSPWPIVRLGNEVRNYLGRRSALRRRRGVGEMNSS